MLLGHLLALMDFLRSSEITQVQLSFKKHAFWVRLWTFNQQLKDSVRSWGVHIWSCLASDSRLLTSLEQFETVLSVLDNVLGLALYKDTGVFVLSNVQGFIIFTVLKQIE